MRVKTRVKTSSCSGNTSLYNDAYDIPSPLPPSILNKNFSNNSLPLPKADPLANSGPHQTLPHKNRVTTKFSFTKIKSKTPVKHYNDEINLLRTLFVGRTDVVSKHWINKKKGTNGYSFVCKNRFVDGLCNNKCSKCSNIDYLPLSREMLYSHIAGKNGSRLGFYPLLTDGTCKLVAADFDEPKNPTSKNVAKLILDEVTELVDKLKSFDLNPYVFTSKSGNGYHVYLFLDRFLPAWKPRALLIKIIKKLKLTCFDRVFPNSETLRGKELGTLIALPYFGKSVKENLTTLFDIDNRVAFPNPWEMLSKAKTTTAEKIEKLVSDGNIQPESQSNVIMMKNKMSGSFADSVMPQITPNVNNGGQYHEEDLQVNDEDLNRELPSAGPIFEDCPFIKHCKENSEHLPEPMWYAMITIISRCKDGVDYIHEVSEGYKGYTKEETDEKIEHALDSTGPRSCRQINADTNGDFCVKCKNFGITGSPIQLGVKDLSMDISEYHKSISKMNDEFCLVNMGSSYEIIREVKDRKGRIKEWFVVREDSMKRQFANKKTLAVKPDGGFKKVNLFDSWMESPLRREYNKGCLFDPERKTHSDGYYNLYNGFGVVPKVGEWDLYKKHLLTVICSGDQKIYDYIMAWMANVVQKPLSNKVGTAIVLRGGEGVGKGVFADTFGKIFGKHYSHLTSREQVTSKFNKHLATSILVFGDEISWGGNKKDSGILKAIITEKHITMEEKFKNPVLLHNCSNLILATNEDWAVPAGNDSRRFLVLDVPSDKANDTGYFDRIFEEMIEKGGMEAMLFDLLRYKIPVNVNLRVVPKTKELIHQRVLSLGQMESFILERLSEGTLSPIQSKWVDPFVYRDVFECYKEFVVDIGDRIVYKNIFGFIKKLKTLIPKTEILSNSGGAKKYGVCDNLAESRKYFEKIIGGKIEFNLVNDDGEKKGPEDF